MHPGAHSKQHHRTPLICQQLKRLNRDTHYLKVNGAIKRLFESTLKLLQKHHFHICRCVNGHFHIDHLGLPDFKFKTPKLVSRFYLQLLMDNLTDRLAHTRLFHRVDKDRRQGGHSVDENPLAGI